MTAHVGIAAVVAALIAYAARRARSLSGDGMVAAFIIGAIVMSAGWDWGALLIAFFVTSSALSRFRRDVRDARIGAIVEKGDARDAVQVLANGGLFALCAAGALAAPSPLWRVLGAGALAASTADTWATEIGTLAGRAPRSIVSGRALAPGTSGGVTWPGTLASIAGASFIALGTVAVGWPNGVALGALVGGVGGSFVDSLLGATAQEQRWCDTCNAGTERRMHRCGSPTRSAGGIPGLRNDAVNLFCTIAGAAFAALVAH